MIATPPPSPPLTGSSNTFRFEEAPILDVVHVVLRDILKVDYMIHPPVSGTVTLATKGDVSADEAAYLLEGALLANGLVMARDSRGTYHVGRPEALRGIVSVPQQVGKGPLAPGYGAVVIPLQFIGAAEMATILRPMMPPEAMVRVDTVRNLLVLAGTRTQAEGWLSIVSTFDIDLLKGMSVGVFPLKHASVREVEAALRVISGAPAAPAGAGAAPPAAAGRRRGRRGRSRDRLWREPVPGRGQDHADRAPQQHPGGDPAGGLPGRGQALDRAPRPPGPQPGRSRPCMSTGCRTARPDTWREVLNGIFGSGGSPDADCLLRVWRPASAPPAPPPSAWLPAAADWARRPAAAASAASCSRASAAGAQAPDQGAGATFKVGGLRVVADEVNNSILVYGTPAEYAKIEAACAASTCRPPRC